MINAPAKRGTAALLFLALFASYLAFSPNTTQGRGYIGEEIEAGLKLLEIFNAWVKGRPIPAMVWNRHGTVPVLLDVPFIKLGKVIVSPDFMMSMSPIVFTAGLLTLLFVWLRKLASPGVSLFLTLTAAFGTLLWPYAYIGLETKQSFFVLLSGYLALADGKIHSLTKLTLFGVVAGFAMTVKSTGIVFGPMFVYLLYVQCRGEWKSRWKPGLAAAAIGGAIWGVGELARRIYWQPIGGGIGNFHQWMIESPLQFFINAIGIFGSPAKGLFVYAPALLLSIYAVPRIWRSHREIAGFALSVTGIMVVLLSLLIVFGDETPGSRYMHVAIAPLILCIGAAWPRFQWRVRGALIPLATLGVIISFLEAYSYYGLHNFAMQDGGLNTMQWINSDPTWNEVAFRAREFNLWLKGCPSTPWKPNYVWVWETPGGAIPWKTIDLRNYCEPQSTLLRDWNNHLDNTSLALFRMCAISLVIGVFLLIALVWRTAGETRLLRDKLQP